MLRACHGTGEKPFAHRPGSSAGLRPGAARGTRVIFLGGFHPVLGDGRVSPAGTSHPKEGWGVTGGSSTGAAQQRPEEGVG